MVCTLTKNERWKQKDHTPSDFLCDDSLNHWCILFLSMNTSPAHKKQALNQLSRLDLEELDLLPTKEEVVIYESHSDSGTTPGADKQAGNKCERDSTAIDTTIGISGKYPSSDQWQILRIT